VAAGERDEVGSIAELKPTEEGTQLGDGIEGAWGGAHGPGVVEAASGVSPNQGTKVQCSGVCLQSPPAIYSKQPKPYYIYISTNLFYLPTKPQSLGGRADIYVHILPKF
jgi:hypothetical protein